MMQVALHKLRCPHCRSDKLRRDPRLASDHVMCDPCGRRVSGAELLDAPINNKRHRYEFKGMLRIPDNEIQL